MIILEISKHGEAIESNMRKYKARDTERSRFCEELQEKSF